MLRPNDVYTVFLFDTFSFFLPPFVLPDNSLLSSVVCVDRFLHLSCLFRNAEIRTGVVSLRIRAPMFMIFYICFSFSLCKFCLLASMTVGGWLLRALSNNFGEIKFTKNRTIKWRKKKEIRNINMDRGIGDGGGGDAR